MRPVPEHKQLWCGLWQSAKRTGRPDIGCPDPRQRCKSCIYHNDAALAAAEGERTMEKKRKKAVAERTAATKQLGRLQLGKPGQRAKYGITFQELSPACKRVYFRLWRAVRRHPDLAGLPREKLFDALRYVVSVAKKIDKGGWDWPPTLHGHAVDGTKMVLDLAPFLRD